MAEILPLTEAVSGLIQDGDTVAFEGFTHLIPFAAAQEVIRQGRIGLTLVRMTPDLVYDQMIGMGCADKLVFSWGGNPGVGSLHRFRDAVQNGWPKPLVIEEYSHAGMAAAYEAGASNLPFAMLRAFQGGGLPAVNPQIRDVVCPYSGERLATVPAIRPDVTVIHAQRADRNGNVLLEGIVGVQKECVFAAQKSLVTVEEVVDDLKPAGANAMILPGWTISVVSEAPRGAYPSYTHGYYGRSNVFYKNWDRISRDRGTFLAWMDENVMRRPLARRELNGSR